MIQTDCLIIGAGPCGLFQIFELGLLDIRAHVVDTLAKPGGQCAELYPDKPIYDIPGYPVVGAQELVEKLLLQIKPFAPAFHLSQQVTELKAVDGGFHVKTSANTEFEARSVVIAGGVGAFQPIMLKLEGLEKHHDTQVFYRVQDPGQHHGKKVVVLGGGDSALDWTLNLYDKAASLTLIHRSDKFRAAMNSVSRMKALCGEGRMQLLLGNVMAYRETAGRLSHIEVQGIDQTRQILEADHLLVFYGLSPKLGPIADWGLSLNKHQINVDTEKFQTSQPGIYAVGDINSYPGKKKLILSGFHEAALAAFAIKHQLFPNEKVLLQYTTTSTALHKKLGVESPKD